MFKINKSDVNITTYLKLAYSAGLLHLVSYLNMFIETENRMSGLSIFFSFLFKTETNCKRIYKYGNFHLLLSAILILFNFLIKIFSRPFFDI